MKGIQIVKNKIDILIKSENPLECLSNAIHHGGQVSTYNLINHFIPKDFNPLDYENEIINIKSKYQLKKSTVVLLTAVKMEHAVILEEKCDKIDVLMIVTAGITNSCSPADPPINLYKISDSQLDIEQGTINIIIIINAKAPEYLPPELFISITEAKSYVLQKHNIKTKYGNPATGTSTDAIGVCFTNQGTNIKWSGYSTEFGHRIGKMVIDTLEKALGNGDYI